MGILSLKYALAFHLRDSPIFGQAAKEEKLETDQEEDEPAMTFLDNFPGNNYMICHVRYVEVG